METVDQYLTVEVWEIPSPEIYPVRDGRYEKVVKVWAPPPWLAAEGPM